MIESPFTYHDGRIRSTISKHLFQFLKQDLLVVKLDPDGSTCLFGKWKLRVGWWTTVDVKYSGENKQQVFAMDTSVTIIITAALHCPCDIHCIVLKKNVSHERMNKKLLTLPVLPNTYHRGYISEDPNEWSIMQEDRKINAYHGTGCDDHVKVYD